MKKIVFGSEVTPLRNLKLLIILSFIITILVAMVSVAEIIHQKYLYSAANLLQIFVPNDIINLMVGLPFLFISLLLTIRGKLPGLLCWPAAIFYFVYVYFPYIICVPFNYLFLPYLILFSLSIYTLIGVIVSIDSHAVCNLLSTKAPYRIFGGILIGLGVLIILRQTALIINALINNTIIETPELAVWIDDFVVGSPAMLTGGYLLWKKKPLGYVVSPGLFISYGILSIGLIPFILIQSHLKNTSVDIFAIAVLIVMALICLIPFGVFIRSRHPIFVTEQCEHGKAMRGL